MSTPLRTHKAQRANDRAAFRLQLVTAMVTGAAGNTDGEIDEADVAPLIRAADFIIDALEKRRNEEANG